MNVLSLFDGMSCGRVALDRLGVPVENYFASEIDKYAIEVSENNYPDIERLGDVTELQSFELPKIDLFIGGSPCQGFSFAGKQLAFDDPRSKLFFEYVRLLKDCQEVNPDLVFLLENVRMKKEYQDIISGYLGVEPVRINSNLVSAQNRDRFYWTNIPGVTQPEDKGLVLEDIIENSCIEKPLSDAAIARIHRKKYSSPQVMPNKTGTINTKNNSGQLSFDSGTTLVPVIKRNGELIYKPNKAQCLDANYHKGADNHGQRTVVANLVERRSDVAKEIRRENAKKGRDYTPFRSKDLVARTDGKVNCLQTSLTKDHILGCISVGNVEGMKYECNKRVYSTKGKCPTITAASGGQQEKKIALDASHWRKLTPLECERLQTLPDNYTAGVSNTQRYRMCGNGWTVDVIAHILKDCEAYAKGMSLLS